MKTKLNLLIVVALVASLLGGNLGGAPTSVKAAPDAVAAAGSVDLTGYSSPKLTAVDPLAWSTYGDVLPARPFLYSVDDERHHDHTLQ